MEQQDVMKSIGRPRQSSPRRCPCSDCWSRLPGPCRNQDLPLCQDRIKGGAGSHKQGQLPDCPLPTAYRLDLLVPVLELVQLEIEATPVEEFLMSANLAHATLVHHDDL